MYVHLPARISHPNIQLLYQPRISPQYTRTPYKIGISGSNRPEISDNQMICAVHSGMGLNGTFPAALYKNDSHIQKHSLQYSVEEGTTMSLCGMVKCSAGIVAFGDSKNTIVEMGTPRINEKRSFIKKVFKFDKFLMAAAGANQFVFRDRLFFLDDIIAAITIDDRYTYKEYLELLYNTVSSSLTTTPLILMFGYKDPEYGIVSFEISRMGVKRQDFCNTHGMQLIGSVEYAPSVYECPDFTDINGAEKFASEYMEKVIELGNLLSVYNPIGEPVQIYSLS